MSVALDREEAWPLPVEVDVGSAAASALLRVGGRRVVRGREAVIPGAVGAAPRTGDPRSWQVFETCTRARLYTPERLASAGRSFLRSPSISWGGHCV